MSTPYRRTFFRLLTFLSPYRRGLLISVGLAAGSQVLALVLIFLTKAVINVVRDGTERELWELIALHHRGLSQMPRLRGQAGTYPANEGIWIETIKAEFQAEL